jgi:hypothetical protein
MHVGSEKSDFLRGCGDDSWLQQHSKAGYIARSVYAVAATIGKLSPFFFFFLLLLLRSMHALELI